MLNGVGLGWGDPSRTRPVAIPRFEGYSMPNLPIKCLIHVKPNPKSG